MEEQEIFEKLKKKLEDSDLCDILEGKLTLDSKFWEDLGLDSLDQYELLYSAEEEFGINIPEEEAYKFETPRDYINYIKNHQ